MRTYNLPQKLAKNTDKLVVHELATFERRVFQPLDLLLDDDFKGGCTNEQSWC